MNALVAEMVRYVGIALVFGLIWAAIQYANGQIRDPVTLAGPVILFGLVGLAMWGLRRLVVKLRGR